MLMTAQKVQMMMIREQMFAPLAISSHVVDHLTGAGGSSGGFGLMSV